MDKETYEKQKAFAGEKKPSMNRRMIDHDYQERQMYMITMVTEGAVHSSDGWQGAATAQLVRPMNRMWC